MIDGQDFTLDAGETKILEIDITNSDGSKVDLTGATVYWVMYGKTVLVSKNTTNGITIVDAANGKIEVKLNPIDTQNYGGHKYKHIAKIVDATGDASNVTKGAIQINPSPI